MPRHDKVKRNRANGQTGGKNCSSTFVLTPFISFGLFNIFWQKPWIKKITWKFEAHVGDDGPKWPNSHLCTINWKSSYIKRKTLTWAVWSEKKNFRKFLLEVGFRVLRLVVDRSWRKQELQKQYYKSHLMCNRLLPMWTLCPLPNPLVTWCAIHFLPM